MVTPRRWDTLAEQHFGNRLFIYSSCWSQIKNCLLIHASVKQCLSFESKNGEYDGACVNTCECVTCGEDVHVPDDVLVVVVVAAERDESAHAQAVRVEHLKS